MAKKVKKTSSSSKYRDKDWLYNQYIELEKTIYKIAKEQKVSESTIVKWLII